MSKLKVLILTDYFYPHWTGLVKSTYNLTQTLKQHFDFTVLTVQYDRLLKQDEMFNGVHIVRAPYLFSLSRAKYSLSLLGKSLGLIKKIDVILMNTPFTNALPISIVAKFFNKKLVICHHGDLILPRSLSNKVIEKSFDFLTLLSFWLSDKVSTHTQDYAENSRVLKYFMHKFTPLLPIITDRRKLRNNNPGIRKIFDDLRSKYSSLFGFGGRFVEEKGFDILFEAIPLVIQKLPSAHFVFAGKLDMGYENFFEKNRHKYEKVKKHITLLGFLNDSELEEFHKSIDYIVIPSRSDCFPVFQAEAMLQAKPSIVTDIPGASYLVRSTKFGFLAKKENVLDLAEKLINITYEKSNIMNHFPKVLKILDNKKSAQAIRKYIEE